MTNPDLVSENTYAYSVEVDGIRVLSKDARGNLVVQVFAAKDGSARAIGWMSRLDTHRRTFMATFGTTWALSTSPHAEASR